MGCRSPLRRARQTHAFDDARVLGEVHGVVAFDAGAESAKREARVDGETCFQLLARFVEPAQMGETAGQMEVGPRIVAIRVDRLPQPAQRRLVFAEIGFRIPDVSEAEGNISIGRAEAKGFEDVSLGLFCAADKDVGHAHRTPR